MTSICDERGQELIYAGMPITEVFKQDMGIGGVLSLLWFQRRLPPYACQGRNLANWSTNSAES
jgi:ATP citrate (pro-S)-lyase